MSSALATPCLEHPDRLEPDRDAEPRRREAGSVVHGDRRLAERGDPVAGRARRASASVAAPSTISTSSDAGTGLKKCRPKKSAGRLERGRERVDRDRRGVGCDGRAAARSSPRCARRASILRSRSPRGPPRRRGRTRRMPLDVGAGRERGRRRRLPALDARGEHALDAALRRRREVGVALDDGDLGAGQQERVRDARAHAAAAEHADARRDAVTSSSSVPGTRSSAAASRGSRTARPAPRGRRPGARRAARANTRFVSWVARGSLAAIRSAIAWAASSSSSAACSDDTSPAASASLGIEHAPGQQQLDREGVADDLLEAPGRAGGGDDAEAGLGVADAGVGRRDADVGRVGELGAAAERVAVDRGDDRHRQLVDADERVRVDPGAGVVGAALAQLGDVGARREHAARAGEDQDAGLGLELGAQVVQRVDRRLVDRVADRRAGRGWRPRDPAAARRGAPCRSDPPRQTRSTISAVPWPTPTHIVARP